MSRRGKSVDSVEEFRNLSKRSKREHDPIERPELLTIVGLGLLICVAPWMLGSMRPWQQLVLFGISLLTFAQLFVPAHGRDERPKGNLKRLLKFPVFWFGLLLVIYITIQALNPAYNLWMRDMPNWESRATGWMTLPIKHIEWLPSGIKVPWMMYASPWMAMIRWSTMLLAMCAAWLGIRQRRCLVALLWVICFNGTAVALVGLLMKVTDADMLLWSYASSNDNFFSAFHYRNHAGAYLYPTLALSLGLFFYYQERARRRLQRSHPGYVFLLLALVLSAALLVCMSRGGVLIGATVIATFIALLLFCLCLCRDWKGLSGSVVLLTISGVAGSYVVQKTIGYDYVTERFRAFFSDDGDLQADASARMRLLLNEASYEMFQDRLMWGWGAGSYQWGIRNYQVREQYERLWYYYKKGKLRIRYRLSIKFAHNDLLQYLAEYGIVGSSFLLGIALSWLGLAIYYIRALTAAQVIIFIGCLAAVAHATFEFNLSNPSVLLLVSMMGALGVIWMKLNPRFQRDDDYA